MSHQNHLLMQPETGQALKSSVLDVNALNSVQRKLREEHLARLFRHVGQRSEGIYLQDLVMRYREIDTP